MSDKGRTYYCKWKLEKGQYIGWVEKHPKVRAAAKSIGDLWDRLGEQVSDHFDDMEAALDFDPPLRATSAWDHVFEDGYEAIGWNSAGIFTNPDHEVLTSDICSECGRRGFERTATPLKVSCVDNADGANLSGEGAGGNPLVVSDRFLALLTATERRQFKTRPVERGRGARLKFHEIIPKGVFEPVAVRKLKVSGWRCNTCGYKIYSNMDAFGVGVNIIRRSDFESVTRGLFFVDESDLSICMPAKRVAELIKNGIRQLARNRLGVIEDRQVDPNPKLPAIYAGRKNRRKQ